MTLILVLVLYSLDAFHTIQEGSRQATVKFVGMLLAYFCASIFYKPLATWTALWIPYPGLSLQSDFVYFPQNMIQQMDQVYFQAVAFILIFILIMIVTHIIKAFMPSKQDKMYPKNRDVLVGAVVAIIYTTLCLCLLFTFLATLTFPWLQNFLADNMVSDFFIRQVPFFSKHILSLWLDGVATL